MHHILIALQFLTRLPVRLARVPSAEETGRSLLTYPLVGALIGGLLLLLSTLLHAGDAWLQAALLLVVWVALSGALHLDGLADSADAFLGGHGDRPRTLSIMKDPRTGPMGVVAVVLLLLIKLVALAAALRAQQWSVVLWAPVVGRTALIGLFLTTPYVRTQGLGRALADHLPRHEAGWVLALVALMLPLALGWPGLKTLALIFFLAWLLRWWMMRILGGTTGDTAGAMVELIEAACLLALVW